MSKQGEAALRIAKAIQDEVPRRGTPPDEGLPSETEQIIPISVVRGTRGYLERVVNQVNGCYEHGWFDACAVMLRRLIETLLIEAFEREGLVQKIQDANGDFSPLDDLIGCTLNEPTWNLSRTTRRCLPRIKTVGDHSAHNRRYNAHRVDIDNIASDVRVVVQELVTLAAFK